MPSHRSPSRAVYSSLGLQKLPNTARRRKIALAVTAGLLCLLLAMALFLRHLSCEMAMSEAIDAVTLAVNDSVARVFEEHQYTYDYFVTLEKNDAGSITAITTNTARINLVSAEILREMVRNAGNQTLELRIPLGNLLGSSLLLGKGPAVPVQIVMLTSSFVQLDDSLSATGINQSRHAITLEADVNLDILIPWATVSTTVETDILIAETVILGAVPETYISVTEGNHGSE